MPAESHRRLYYPAATATGIVQLPPLDPAQDLDPVPPSLKPSLRLLLVKIHALRRRIDFLDERVTDCRRDAGSGLELNTVSGAQADTAIVVEGPSADVVLLPSLCSAYRSMVRWTLDGILGSCTG